MNIYPDRYGDDFQEYLYRELSLECLLQNSHLTPYTRNKGGKEYNKCCRIDYSGLAATTLLDSACLYVNNDKVPNQFEKIFSIAEELNKNDIFVKMRFLFMYPYASSFFSIIQAESSSNRSAVDSPAFLRDFQITDEVDDETFYASASVRNLKHSLVHLQELIKKYNWDNESPNSIRVRFTPIDIKLSLIIINNSLYYSPYLLAKNKRTSDKLSLMAPVLHLDRKSDESTFLQFEDHFRYLWDLDTTMVCEDATAFDINSTKSLSKIRPPSQVIFDAKAKLIQTKINAQSEGIASDEEIRNWKFRLKHILQRFSADTRPTPSKEAVFIACSWEIGKDSKSSPNKYATELSEWLEHDFGNSRNVPLISVHVLEASTGGSLAQQVYARLREATLAIILLTKDIECSKGDYHSKANVLHEMGYLMRQLDSGRLIVLSEKGVIVPSNIRDNVYIEFSSDKLSLCYREVVKWLGGKSSLIPSDIIANALSAHVERMDKMLIEGKLEKNEADKGKKRLTEEISLIGQQPH